MEKEPYFITFADLPPSPFDEEKVSWYRELFNTFILTEDDVSFTDGNGRVSASYLKAIETLEKSKLNIFIRNMYNDPDYFDNPSFKSASNYDTPYTLSPRKITTELGNKAVTGFYMADEPFMKPFSLHPEYANLDELTKLVDFKNQYYPDAFFHMNMIPSSSYDHFFFTNKKNQPLTYEDFIRYYTEVIVKRVKSGGVSLCLDCYPFVYKDYIDPDYLNDLLTVSEVTREYNLTVSKDKAATFGVCIQTFCCTSQVDPREKRDITSQEEISFQLYTAVALGAKLLEYFCFRPYSGCPGAILDHEGNKRIFDLVKSANELALPMGDYLEDKTYQGVCYFRGENPYLAYRGHTDPKRFLPYPAWLKSAQVSSDVLGGYFSNKEKEVMVFVNFSDPIQKRKVHLHFIYEGKEILIYHKKNVTISPNKAVDVMLDEGDAILIEVSK